VVTVKIKRLLSGGRGGSIIPDIIMNVFLLLILFVTLYPFIHMLAVSLSRSWDVMQNNVSWYPVGFNLETYKKILTDNRILAAYMNTILYTTAGTAISLSFTTMAAYALSKTDRPPFFKFFNIIVIIPMFFTGGLIPLYLVVRDLGMLNTIWALVLVGAVEIWYLLVMRSFFTGFPHEIEESGMIEGLNDIGILWRLVLPLSKAPMATIGLFYAVRHWNQFFMPFIFLDDAKKYPLQVLVRSLIFIEQGNIGMRPGALNIDVPIVPEAYRYATIIVTILPIVMLYPFLQKYFVKGVMVGSLKG